MDINFTIMLNRKIFILFVTIFLSPLVLSQDILDNNFTVVTKAIPIADPFTGLDGQYNQDISILEESIAIPNIDNLYSSIKNINVLGNFVFENEAAELVISKLETISGLVVKQEELTKYKVAYNKSNNSYKISDGSIVISFNGSEDSFSFGKEYNLTLKYNFPNTPVYKTTNFLGINDLIKELRQDGRVKSVNFDLIDPRNSLR